jgi:hypothetical protein
MIPTFRRNKMSTINVIQLAVDDNAPVAIGVFRSYDDPAISNPINAFTLKTVSDYGPIDLAGGWVFLYSLRRSGEIIAANGPYRSVHDADSAASNFEKATDNLSVCVMPFKQIR